MMVTTQAPKIVIALMEWDRGRTERRACRSRDRSRMVGSDDQPEADYAQNARTGAGALVSVWRKPGTRPL